LDSFYWTFRQFLLDFWTFPITPAVGCFIFTFFAGSLLNKDNLCILIAGGNMPVKTPVKKTAKNAQKPVKKPVKRITQADIEANFAQIQKSQDEAWAAIKETHENIFGLNKSRDEAWKAIKETQKNIGGLNNSLGSIVEHILTPGLPKKFKKLGYSFNRIATYKFAEGVYAQIDGMLENGEQAIAVEVKTTLRQADIEEHLVRMEKIRKYADEHGDKRQFMGAMAATITDEDTKTYALKKGFLS
jgi:hypothetical protein